MPPQGEVARQWFIPGEGIDRNVISTDIQRYLGNDATVRPGAGTGEYQGVNGYWIKAYRNLTSAMIADLRADSTRWRQEQRQTGVGSSAYVGSDTFNQSNAAGISRNSPSLDQYGQPVRGPMTGRPDDGRRPPPDQMQVDLPPGRPPQGQGYNQPGYYPQDGRGQFPQDPARGYPNQPNQRPAGPPGDPGYGQQNYNPYPSPAATVSSINQNPRERDSFGNQPGYPQPSTPYDQYGNPIQQQRRPQGYPDQPMSDYGQPDQFGRYPVSQAYGQERGPQGYNQPVQGPPPGYTRSGEYYVPMTTGYDQPNMMATAAPGQQYPPQAQGRGGQNPGYSSYPQEPPVYPPQGRDSNHGRPPARGDDRQRRRDR